MINYYILLPKHTSKHDESLLTKRLATDCNKVKKNSIRFRDRIALSLASGKTTWKFSSAEQAREVLADLISEHKE